ncbi:uncharacterized protein LOC131940949 [Physella acuta]|uniref:uncharacterized protein LOC131940949 n=1 Tax=Physella acuta TaxID=109671 RepID=UPI0027DC12E2|nr:uncharacterized protein LOC131940949 [Physella acuta]XP_059155867.1 uncharacterized protein LOC131940949 [Physella acuta]
MATGHILPGYGEPVSRLRRVRSAGFYPLDSTALQNRHKDFHLSPQEFEEIKENAKRLWNSRAQKPTTYETFHNGGEINELTQAKSRPSSSDRRNNPHPPQVFLTTRLRYIEGNPNLDSTIRKNPSLCQVLKITPEYLAQNDPALLRVYKDPYGFKQILPPKEAQAAEAWVKLADDVDHERVYDIVRDHEETRKLQETARVQRPKSSYPSLHRWMKNSGVDEYNVTSRIMQTLRSDPLRDHPPCDYNPHIRSQYQCLPHLRRGEYSMHPDWPSTLPHHRVP